MARSTRGRRQAARVARASRVLVSASSPRRTFLYDPKGFGDAKVRCRETRQPARETRALPGLCRASAFTVVELLVVMAIILVLAGLVLGTSSYVHNKGARSRAEAEIAAMSAALENYKADNGSYPESPDTDGLNAQQDGDPAAQAPNVYTKASLFLYEKLSGANADRSPGGGSSYFTFKDNQLSPATGTVSFIKDPFGNSYGYSTAFQKAPSNGYNPTFDLWSTSGTSANPPNQAQWIKNW